MSCGRTNNPILTGSEEPIMKNTALIRLRKQIDHADDALVSVLLKRVSIVRKIATIKMREGMPIRDRKREKALVDRLCTLSGDTQQKRLIRSVYKVILQHSRDTQRRIRQGVSGLKK
jgi:chorismate mutase